MKNFCEAGFTLIELLVVVLIIGILAGISVPYYLKAEETSKANQAIALANMVATANRMYAVDHQNQYLSGVLNSSCSGGSANCGSGGVCDLIYCGYLTQQDWSNSPYQVSSEPVNSTNCSGLALSSCVNISGLPPSADLAACAKRQGTNTSPYKGWGYAVDANGVTYACGGAPAPPPQ